MLSRPNDRNPATPIRRRKRQSRATPRRRGSCPTAPTPQEHWTLRQLKPLFGLLVRLHSIAHLIGRGRCLGALSVALSQEYGDKVWFASTLQLQLSLLQLCILCRTRPVLHLRVEHDTPATLRAVDDSRFDVFQDTAEEGPCPMRVPPTLARVVKW